MATRKKSRRWSVVFEGSQLDGPSVSIAEFAKLEIPPEFKEAYRDLFFAVDLIEEFFIDFEHGEFRSDGEDEDGVSPGMSDQYFKIVTRDPVAFRAELRERLIERLGLPDVTSS